MYLLTHFFRTHSSGDLWVLFFFVTIGVTVVGWIIDFTIRERGFGCVGNGLLILLGAMTGLLISQMVGYGYLPSMSETYRVLLFSSASAALILLMFCAIKSWVSVT